MHLILAGLVIVLAGWTATTHVAVIGVLPAGQLPALAPFLIAVFALAYIWSRRWRAVPTPSVALDLLPARAPTLLPWALLVSPVALLFSWTLFWLLACLILAACAMTRTGATRNGIEWPPVSPRERLAVTALALIGALLALAVSRPDLDDAFYLAIAAQVVRAPAEALLSADPMYGESNLPLLLPSYRFASFEVLVGALAQLLNTSVADVAYRALPPFFSAASVLCLFLLARELLPDRAIPLAVAMIVCLLLFGEMHRSFGNFWAVRMFQGKAVFVSLIVPAIFLYTWKYFSARGHPSDVLLLAFLQLSGIGMTNFGLLAAPVTGAIALLSGLRARGSVSIRMTLPILTTLLISLPYVAYLLSSPEAFQSHHQFPNETPAEVWASIFGSKQQYFIAMALLAGPVLTTDPVLRQRLAIPLLVLFAVLLNPLLAEMISAHVTTPPVYWRVVWTAPLIPAAGVGVWLLLKSLFTFRVSVAGDRRWWIRMAIAATFVGSFVISVPYSSLRGSNGYLAWDFAGLKLRKAELAVAREAVKITDGSGRLLAPDQVAGVISGFHARPPLVNVRGFYNIVLARAFGGAEYGRRMILRDFVTDNFSSTPERDRSVSESLNVLCVVTVVMAERNLDARQERILANARFKIRPKVDGYYIWTRSYRDISPSSDHHGDGDDCLVGRGHDESE